MSLQNKIKTVSVFLLTICLLSNTRVSAVQKPYRSHINSEKKIALTFDDGPHPVYTKEILDILSEYGIKATFFVIGKNCETNREIVCREILEGHEIGNHTYSHPHLSGISGEKLRCEIEKTDNILFELYGYKPRLFRPPEGVYSTTVSLTLENLNYIPILWTVDTTDWRSPGADRIASEVINNIKSGNIILCHDYVAGKSNTPAALRIFIPKLLEMGYEFVTVSELLTASPVAVP